MKLPMKLILLVLVAVLLEATRIYFKQLPEYIKYLLVGSDAHSITFEFVFQTIEYAYFVAITIGLTIILIKNKNSKRDDTTSFQDIDKSYKQTKSKQLLETIKEIENQETYSVTNNATSSITKNLVKISDKNPTPLEPEIKNTYPSPSSFEKYFLSISNNFETNIDRSDEKASVLLDKGILYAKAGMIFYATSIIIWQYLYLNFLNNKHFIYGIASCTILFTFIEFISAWFLKQYKNFVDTSTYLVKIKSIFDKYYLCYLAIHDSATDPEHLDKLLPILSNEIKWPDTYLLKKADVGFAKEAMESMTCLLDAIKSQAKAACAMNKDEGKPLPNRAS